MKRICNKLKNFCWKFFRKKVNKRLRKELANPNVSIISNNCTGGIISHDLGLRFLSPTVNLFMEANDFVKLCENLEYYLGVTQIEEVIDTTRNYPVGKLGDITLYFVHYKTFEEARKKWLERRKRVDLNNIRIFGCDRDGMTEQLMDRFGKLPYPKVLFTHLPMDRNYTYYIKGYEKEKEVGLVLDGIGWKGKRVIDQFDYVRFLNEGKYD